MMADEGWVMKGTPRSWCVADDGRVTKGGPWKWCVLGCVHGEASKHTRVYIDRVTRYSGVLCILWTWWFCS